MHMTAMGMILDHQKRRTRRQRGYQYPAGQQAMVEGVRPAMTSRRAMIDRQLAVIATARRQALPAENRLLKILLRSWSRTTRRVSAARARERAWRAVRSERLLGSAVTAWHSWARKNRASDSEWAARVEIVQKRRLSRALFYFKTSCARSKHRRQLKQALQIVNNMSQRRPMERKWSRWQAIVREVRVKAVFFAWAKSGRRKRRIRIAAGVLHASKETAAVVGVWNTWRRMAGASKLARLLEAWDVIGPARQALEVMQSKAKKVRAEQWRRVQLLRRGLHCGFTVAMANRRQMRAFASHAQTHSRKHVVRHGLKTLCRNTAGALWSRKREESATNYCRKRTLRKGLDRWMLRHRLNLLLAVFRRRFETTRLSASIEEWARKTASSRAARVLEERTKRHALASCMGRLEETAACRRASRQSSAAATAKWRRSRLGQGLMCWRSRGRATQRQQRFQGAASAFRRLSSLRRGLTCLLAFTEQQTRALGIIRAKNTARQAAAIARWREVVREFRANCKATSSNQARGLSLAVSAWRVGASRFKGQRDLAWAADVHLRRRFGLLSFKLWRSRVDRAIGAEATTQRFQHQRKLRLGLSGIRRCSEKRGLARLATWRAQVWAGAFRATYALRKWRNHAESTGDLEASFRIAKSRRLNSEIAHRRCSSPLAKRALGALRGHARDRQLKRRLLKDWLGHTKILVRTRKQAQLFRVRSGLRALRSWAKLSPYLRHRRLLVLNHSTRRVTQSIFSAWKSAVFPLGLRGQWAPRVRARRDGKPAQDEGIRLRLPKTSKTINAASSGEVEYLGLIEATPKSDQGGRSPLKDATNEQADKISLNHDSLVLLRLPMVGKRMRRVLHAWRKLAKKGKRLNYIRDMLPQKMGHVFPGPPHVLFKATNSALQNLHCGVGQANYNQRTVVTLRSEKGKGHGCPKIPNNAREVDLGALRRTGCGQGRDKVVESSAPINPGRRSGGGRCRGDRSADFLVDAVGEGSGQPSGGSYLARYLLRSPNNNAPPVNP